MDSDCPLRRTDNTMAKRYQRGNQNPYIKEEQTTQWPKDTKGAIRIHISKKNRQHNGQKIPKGQSESIYQRRTDNMCTLDRELSIYNTESLTMENRGHPL
jgi:hypothetical protein